MTIKSWIKEQKVVNLINRGVGILLALSYLLAVFAILRTNILPGQYLGLILLATFAVVLGFLFLHFRAKLTRSKKIILIVVSSLGVIANLIVFATGLATTHFIDTVSEGDYRYQEYSVVALKEGHIVLTEGNYSMGVVAIDTNLAAIKEAVAVKLTPNYLAYADPTSLTMAVSDQSADTAVLSGSYLQLLKDNNPELYDTLEILYTFTTKTQREVTPSALDMTKPFIVYISGIDTYGGVGTVSRSDVNMLAVVNPRTHKVLLVNTPRDYYVQLHGTTGTPDKLTHAGIYGIDMSMATMQDLYGIPIDYNVRINFSSLVAIVDTLGGVDVQSDYAFTGGRDTFNVGMNHLNGSQALNFSRERKSFEGGDRTRGQNQQRVIEAIIAKMSTPETLVKYQQVLKSLEGTFQTSLSSNDITSLFKYQLDTVAKWQTSSISVDGAGAMRPAYSMGQLPLSVVIPDEASVASARNQIKQHLQ